MRHVASVVLTFRHVEPQLFHVGTMGSHGTIAIGILTLGRVMKEQKTLLFVSDPDLPFLFGGFGT